MVSTNRASKGLLRQPETNPNVSGEKRIKWLTAASNDFVSPSEANKKIYKIILDALWPEGHGIPGPVLSEKDVRVVVVANYHSARSREPYKDVFRRLRELQGEEGFTCIIKEGTKYQLQSLELSAKREPRAKLEKKLWSELKKKFNFKCTNCGAQEPQVKLSPDHKRPRSKGGGNEIENWQPLCEQCNNIKSTACRGCNLNCFVCSWAFPEKYKQIIISDDNKELIGRAAEKAGSHQSDFANRIIQEYFNKAGKG